MHTSREALLEGVFACSDWELSPLAFAQIGRITVSFIELKFRKKRKSKIKLITMRVDSWYKRVIHDWLRAMDIRRLAIQKAAKTMENWSLLNGLAL